MTNPTPEYGAQIKFDSIGAAHHQHQSFGKLTVVSSTHPEGGLLADALLSPETTVLAGKSGMDPLKKDSSNTIVKKQTTTKAAGDNKKRKTSFLVDDQNEIVEQVHEYEFPDDCDHEDVWWTDDELDQLLTDAMLVAEHYTTKRKDWQNKIKLVLKGCAGGKSKDGKPLRIKASDLDFVVDCEARGLELYIHPIFQKNREKAIKGVVKVQAEYNASEKKKGKKDPELRLKVLKAQSLKLTQTARMMAKTLADGDKRAAEDEHDEDVFNNLRVSLTGIPPGEEVVPSEELRTPSVELKAELEEDFSRPPPRPRRALSPMRKSLRSSGLKELQDQNKRRLLAGAGGIRGLEGELEEISENNDS